MREDRMISARESEREKVRMRGETGKRGESVIANEYIYIEKYIWLLVYCDLYT